MSLSSEPGVPPVDPERVERTGAPRVELDDEQHFSGSIITHGSSAVLSAWLWYDADGDGVREPGEPEGHFTRIVGRDLGIFRSDTTKVPQMALSPELPLAERHPDDR